MKGKNSIIITGANGAIGSELVKKFLADGYQVAGFYHQNKHRLEQIKHDGNLFIHQCNLADYEQLKNALHVIKRELGHCPTRILHTAALRSSDFCRLADTDPALWKTIVDFNIYSCFNLLHVMLPCLAEMKNARIVLIGSNISRTGLKFGSAYAASKGALSSMVRSIASEYGKYGILITLVSPGPVNSDQSHFPKEYQEFRKEYFKRELENTPTHRLIEVEDIFQTSKFLLSDENQSITGEEIFLTGGKL